MNNILDAPANKIGLKESDDCRHCVNIWLVKNLHHILRECPTSYANQIEYLWILFL